VRDFLASDAPQVERDVVAAKTPAVLRGLIADWPAVKAAAGGFPVLIDYLKRFASDSPVDALLTPPEVEGRIFYNEGMTGFNFHRNRLPLMHIAEQLLRYSGFASAPAVAAQSALIRDCLPGFSAENSLSALGADILPRIWMGNRITTPAHVDEWNNIGCVVAGRRRFRLFPPEQVENLYVGPLDFAPTGAPMSLVQMNAPDFSRFPKFRDALAASEVVELSPGDGIYIPPLWWHHVESLDACNVLVNYWWHDTDGDGAQADSAFEALVHAILAIRSLPAPTRRAWAALFDQWVLGEELDVEHIPANRRGILGALSPEQRVQLRQHLAKRLTR
jgi:Cupin-like domain